MPRADFRFFHPLRVRWAEVDPQGVVFNPNYFTYLDVAVTEYYRALDMTYPRFFVENACDAYAVRATGDFVSSARYDEEIELGVRVASIGNTSVTFAAEFYRDETLLFRGELVYVTVTLTDGAKMRVPDAFREHVRAYERVAPSEATPAPA